MKIIFLGIFTIAIAIAGLVGYHYHIHWLFYVASIYISIGYIPGIISRGFINYQDLIITYPTWIAFCFLIHPFWDALLVGTCIASISSKIFTAIILLIFKK